LIAGKYSGSTWEYPTITSSVSPSINISGLTSFSDFQFAEQKTSTDLQGTMSDMNISVYKNMFNHIVVHCNESVSGTVIVSNAVGQKLFSTPLIGVTTVIEQSFNPGMYLVTVLEAGRCTTKRVIIR